MRYRKSTQAAAPARIIQPEARRAARRLFVFRRFVALASSAILLIVFEAPLPAQDNPSEYQLKAAFVYNFAKFVDWPPNAFSSPQSPFVICILGADPFGSVIDDALRGKTVATHPVVIRRVKDAASARRCAIVFVSTSEKNHVSDILQGMKGANALVVGDFGGFAAAGGAIDLTLQDSRVRFAINPAAADDAGLRISSKLLALATIVRGGAENGRN